MVALLTQRPTVVFGDICHKEERLFRSFVSGGVTNINVQYIVSQFVSQEASSIKKARCIFVSATLPNSVLDCVLVDSINIYMKIRAHVHAKQGCQVAWDQRCQILVEKLPKVAKQVFFSQ